MLNLILLIYKAAQNGHIEVLSYFLELGVDIKAKDNKNLTVFDYGKTNKTIKKMRGTLKNLFISN